MYFQIEVGVGIFLQQKNMWGNTWIYSCKFNSMAASAGSHTYE